MSDMLGVLWRVMNGETTVDEVAAYGAEQSPPPNLSGMEGTIGSMDMAQREQAVDPTEDLMKMLQGSVAAGKEQKAAALPGLGGQLQAGKQGGGASTPGQFVLPSLPQEGGLQQQLAKAFK
jgi:hypothetical protein